MRNELENIELIEKYLRNELSESEKIAFETKLKTDTQLQKEIALQREVVKGIERIGVKQSINRASKVYQNRRRGFFLGLFLIVMISGVVGINYLKNNTEPLKTVNKDVVKLETLKQNTEERDSLFEVVTEEETILEAVSLPKKQFQYFTINSSEESIITGNEGTRIKFKANSFDVPKNSSIKIRLKEYYKMSDIAFANLTTETVGDKLLETGGMVYVDAVLNNKIVNLKKDTFFDINFPFEKKKKDMILFDGEIKNKNVVWKESTANKNSKLNFAIEEFNSNIAVMTIVEKMPEFKGGQSKLFEYLGKNIKYPEEAKAKNISGKVYLNFIVETDGRISNVKVLRGVNPILDKEAKRVVENMPNWNPGKQRDREVAVSYNLPINFKLDGSTVTYTEDEIKYFSDSLRTAQRADTEEKLFEKDGKAEKKSNKEQFNASADINSYALSGSKLGWINCDRFVRGGNLSVMVKLEENQLIEVKMIFHSIKGIMAGANNGLYSRFNRIPSGEKVTIFAVKYLANKPYVCLQEEITSSKPIQLTFEELTKEKLRQITKEINNI